MARPPTISEAEWKIMRIVWKRSPLSLSEIIEALQAAAPPAHPKTVQTLIGRLVKKRALGFERKSRTHLYYPLATEEECVDQESQSFLEQVFGGSLKPMLTHFVEHRKLSAKEIRELKAILDGGAK